MKKIIRLLLATILLMALLIEGALAVVPTRISIARVKQEDNNLILYMTATDSMEAAAKQDYDKSNYSLYMNGTESFSADSVVNFDTTGEKTHYIVCVDISKSIGATGQKYGGSKKERTELISALKVFSDNLNQKEAMSLLTFGDSVTILAEASRNKEELNALIDGIAFTDNNTHLLEAVFKAVDLAYNQSEAYSMNAVLILTDGTDEPGLGGEMYTIENTSEIVKEASIPVYTVGFKRNTDEYDPLRTLATSSGGSVQILDLENFATGLANVQNIIRSAAKISVPLVNNGHGTMPNNEKMVIAVRSGSRLRKSDENYESAVDWSLVPTPTPSPTPTPEPTEEPEAPTPEPTATPDVNLEFLNVDLPVTEDSESVTVRTEKGAKVTITLDGQKVVDAQLVDASGIYKWNAMEELGTAFEAGQILSVDAVDKSGNGPETPVTLQIQSTRRKQITTNVRGLNDGTLLNTEMEIIGQAERNTNVTIEWYNNDNGQYYTKECDVSATGNFIQSFTTEDADPGHGIVNVYYTDGIGISRSDTGKEVFWDSEVDKGVDDTRLIGRLTEDSDRVVVRTEANSEVTVKHSGVTFAKGVGESNEKGIFEFELDADEYLTKGENITIEVIDPLGHSEVFPREDEDPISVDESERDAITVEIQGILENNLLESQEMVVKGFASSKQRVTVSWVKKDGDTEKTVIQSTKQTEGNGEFKVTFPWKETLAGEGYIEAHYADNRGTSKMAHGATSVWITPSPEPVREATPRPVEIESVEERATNTPIPTVAPTYTPTPTPGPTPTPTVTPTLIPWPQNWMHGFTDYFGGTTQMLRDARFWFIVAAALLIVGLIIFLIVTLVKRSSKKEDQIISTEDDDHERGTELENIAGTIRQDSTTGPSEAADETEISGTMRRHQKADPKEEIIEEKKSGGGSVFDDSDEPFEPMDAPSQTEGTVRIRHDAMTSSGTVRIQRFAEGPKPVELRIEEIRDWEGVNKARNVSVIREITIGRGNLCDLVIKDETVSGQHAKIIREGDELFFIDTGSSNGSSINGVEIEKEKRLPLQSGDKIVVGRTVLNIQFEI